MAWILDLDGVVWRGDEPIPGADEAVRLLRTAGEHVVFVTNNAGSRVVEHEAKLARMGIDAEGSVVTSSQVVAGLLEPGWKVLVVGGPGLREEVERRGCERVATGPADAVVCGLDRGFSYDVLRHAADAIRDGARWILANPDPTFPTERGLDPGAGSLAAAISAASGREPTIAGKPHRPMVDLLLARCGPAGTVVGDRPDTDGALAVGLGYRFALVLTGVVTDVDLPIEPAPDVVAADLLAVVRLGQQCKLLQARRDRP